MNRVMRKRKQCGFRPGVTQAELYKQAMARELESRGIVLSAWRNEGADQLLRLYFHICRLFVFSCRGSMPDSVYGHDKTSP